MPLIKANLVGKIGDFFVNKRSQPISSSVVGVVTGICFGANSSIGDDYSGLRSYTPMVTQSFDSGIPNSPCLEISQPGFWRFRWVVKPGQRRISVRVKQIKSFPNMRPTMIIKQNQRVGLNADAIITAPEGTDWTVIGPYVFTVTNPGVVYVELHNNLEMSECPIQESRALFDHIIVT